MHLLKYKTLSKIIKNILVKHKFVYTDLHIYKIFQRKKIYDDTFFLVNPRLYSKKSSL